MTNCQYVFNYNYTNCFGATLKVNNNMQKKAIILLSGGLDSITVLALAKQQGFQCYVLSFDYGQRHNAELIAAAQIAAAYQVIDHKIINNVPYTKQWIPCTK